MSLLELRALCRVILYWRWWREIDHSKSYQWYVDVFNSSKLSSINPLFALKIYQKTTMKIRKQEHMRCETTLKNTLVRNLVLLYCCSQIKFGPLSAGDFFSFYLVFQDRISL